MLVLDQRLGQRRFFVDDVDQVVHHAAFAAHDQVQITQADVEVDHHGFVSAQGQAGRKAGAGSGLADTALTGRYNDNSCHERVLYKAKALSASR
ncbi:hypothetical protein D3C72_2364320 [compost metagenome]